MITIFRAKDQNDPKTWIYGYVVQELTGDMYIIKDSDTSCRIQVLPDTLEQYIGETDKNGAMIFGSFNQNKGGTILRTDEAGWICRVGYFNGAFMGVDDKGGFSFSPNWKNCQSLGNHLDTI